MQDKSTSEYVVSEMKKSNTRKDKLKNKEEKVCTKSR